jgi:uncharacterized protein YceH (UPF0502 family)
MNLGDAEVQDALDSLKLLSLVFESSGSRVARYEHNFQRVRGRARAIRRAAGPADAARAADRRRAAHQQRALVPLCRHFVGGGFLDELQDRSEEKGGPLVVKLPRAPGAREQRWAHLLCGPVDADLPAARPPTQARCRLDDTPRLEARMR